MVVPLNPKERKSIIISLEGGEGAGKTILERTLRERFNSMGLKMMPSLKEPGSTPRAELIRMVLKNTVDTSYPLPAQVREGFNLDLFTSQAARDPLTDYAMGQLGVAMNQLSPLSPKHGLLEYVYHGGFDGMPLDCFDRESFRTKLYHAGESRFLNPLVRLVEELNLESSSGAEKTNKVLEGFTATVLTGEQQARLFFVARNLLWHNVIGPSMHKGYFSNRGDTFVDGDLGAFDLLVLDRSGESTVVYQGHAQDPSKISYFRSENIRAMEGIVPDLTLYLDVSPEIGILRTRKNRGIVGQDFFDTKPTEFHYNVRAGYKSEVDFYKGLPFTDPQHNRIVEIDAHESLDSVAESAWKVISERLGDKIEDIKRLRAA